MVGVDYELLSETVSQHPYPLLFATVSGAHLYGFPSPDSDFDLRGVHILPVREVVGLERCRETIESCEVRQGAEIDLVTHDARKFFSLLLKRNGYVLEQLYSPLVVHTTPEHEVLKEIARDCITRHHAYHYLGFARTEWKLFEKTGAPKVKPLLYVFRVLLTGIHLLRTGEVEANLARLNELFRLPYVDDLISRKVEGTEKQVLPNADVPFFESEYERLLALLEEARTESRLPEAPTAQSALSALLVRLRLEGVSA